MVRVDDSRTRIQHHVATKPPGKIDCFARYTYYVLHSDRRTA